MTYWLDVTGQRVRKGDMVRSIFGGRIYVITGVEVRPKKALITYELGADPDKTFKTSDPFLELVQPEDLI